VPGKGVAVGMTIRYDEEHPNHVRPPSSVARDQPGNDACLPIERGVKCLHVRHSRLDLDQHQRPSTRMPAEDVDRPTVSEVVECVLDERFPTLGREHSHHSLDQGGMVGVEKSGYVGDRPSGRDLDAYAKRLRDPPDGRQSDELEPSRLDIAYDRLVDTSAHAKLTLGPAFPSSQRTDAAPDGDVVHLRIFVVAASRRLRWGITWGAWLGRERARVTAAGISPLARTWGPFFQLRTLASRASIHTSVARRVTRAGRAAGRR
jgi:hypothetical protein